TAELEAYADTVVGTMEEVAPGFTDSIRHRVVIGPYEMEHTYGLVGGNIFHGELAPNQLFHMRPPPRRAGVRRPPPGARRPAGPPSARPSRGCTRRGRPPTAAGA